MTSESITVEPTWGFEFRAVFPDHQRLDSDEHEVEVDLGDPVGRVTMEARRGFTAIRPIPAGPVALRDAKEIVFTGCGYASVEEAENAGSQVGNAVRLAAVQASVDLAIGSQKTPRTRHAQPPDYKPDVPGLSVHRDGMRAGGSLLATAIVLTPLPKFAEALRGWTAPGAMMTPMRALACDLLAQSGFEASPESTHLTLVTALEVLGERRPRTGHAAELVDEFLAASTPRPERLPAERRQRPHRRHPLKPRAPQLPERPPAAATRTASELNPEDRNHPARGSRRPGHNTGPYGDTCQTRPYDTPPGPSSVRHPKHRSQIH
jgi:hypothetical protein